MWATQRRALLAGLVGFAVLSACSKPTARAPGPGTSPTPTAVATISLTSIAFADGATIPVKYSCGAPNPPSPPLAWAGIPQGTAELALIVEDPDAPNGGFVHWVLYGLAPELEGLAEGSLPAEAKQGANGRGQNQWQGPCPPPGNPPHHYVFTLTALSRPLDLGAGASAAQVKAAMSGLILGRGVLTGRFGR